MKMIVIADDFTGSNDTGVQLAPPGADDVLGVGEAERHEEQARLVDVGVVLVDDGDLDVVGELAPQAVGTEGAAGPASEDHEVACHACSIAVGDCSGKDRRSLLPGVFGPGWARDPGPGRLERRWFRRG